MPLLAAEIFQFFSSIGGGWEIPIFFSLSAAAAEIFRGFSKKFLLIEKFSNKKGKKMIIENRFIRK
jgi:hypothetical protein